MSGDKGSIPPKRELQTLFDDDAEPEPSSQRQCVDCRAFAPRESSNHSLISAKYGWRLSRTAAQHGAQYAWRCPKCWQKHRANGGT